jgi:hypothetical protein
MVLKATVLDVCVCDDMGSGACGISVYTRYLCDVFSLSDIVALRPPAVDRLSRADHSHGDSSGEPHLLLSVNRKKGQG